MLRFSSCFISVSHLRNCLHIQLKYTTYDIVIRAREHVVWSVYILGLCE